MSKGKIVPKNQLMMRVFVGTCEDNGNHYDLGSGIGGGEPVVYSRTSNRTFILPWEDIIRLAQSAGVDETFGEPVEEESDVIKMLRRMYEAHAYLLRDAEDGVPILGECLLVLEKAKEKKS